MIYTRFKGGYSCHGTCDNSMCSQRYATFLADFSVRLTWKSVLPHPRIKSASPVNAIACSSQTYVTQPAQVSDGIFTISCFTSHDHHPASIASFFERNIYLFAAIRFVIGRHDKLSSRSSARSSYLRYCVGKKKKKRRELRTDILNSFEKCWMRWIATL